MCFGRPLAPGRVVNGAESQHFGNEIAEAAIILDYLDDAMKRLYSLGNCPLSAAEDIDPVITLVDLAV